MKSANGYVTFGGNCREVMAFYKECFGGELFLMTVGESPMASDWPADAQDDVLHACLTSGGLTLMASDGGRTASETAPGALTLPYVSLMVNCDNAAEIERLFGALSAGGSISCPLGEQFWGATFGALSDKYGVNWMLSLQR